MTPQALSFFQKIFEHLLHLRSVKPLEFPLKSSPPFSRVIVQDSTLIALPGKLASEFSGVGNAHAKTVHTRIQCVLDLLTGRFVHFSIDPYSKNDLKVAGETYTHPGDLLLRDRGYFHVDSFAFQSQQESFFIQRYKHKTSLLDDPLANKPLDLLAALQKKGRLDQTIYFPKHPGTPFRLVAFPVPEEIANLRRMKARKENKGHNPSEELLALMGYTIFITNLLDPAFTPEMMAKLYGLRWRIENIFKTFKSNICLQKCHAVSATQLRVLLCARFSRICLYFHYYFVPLSLVVKEKTGRDLSLMGFMRYLQNHPQSLGRFQGRITKRTLEALVRYCCYDLRKRPHFMQQLENAFADFHP
jgi:hypothetical protein